MFMRYFGGGIGHQGVGICSDIALDDSAFRSEWQDVDEDDVADQAADECDLADELVSEVHGEEDILRLIPDLRAHGPEARGSQEGLENEAGKDFDNADSDKEDEELNAHVGEDEELDSSDGEGVGPMEDEDKECIDEYAEEGFAQL